MEDNQEFVNSPLLLDEVGFETIVVDLDEEGIKLELANGIQAIRLSDKGKPREVTLRVPPPFTHLSYGKKKKRVLLSSIDEIRRGHKTPKFEIALKHPKKIEDPERCLSLVFGGGNTDSCDIMFTNQEHATLWWKCLKYIIAQAKEDDNVNSYLARNWERVTEGKGEIDDKKLSVLLKNLNISPPQKEVKERLRQVDVNGNNKLDYNELLILFDLLNSRPEINELFDKYSQNGKMSVQNFISFLKEQQHEEVNEPQVLQIISRLRGSQKTDQDSTSSLDIRLFEEYLLSDFNAVQERKGIYMDMNFPLTAYYISSSHNTYLSGHQWSSLSSVDMYRRVFKQGCKCVELDIWDGENGEPLITHGHTLVTKITFKSVLEAIRDYGFITSPFPVILSLENHCSIPQQAKMAQYFKEILGDLLPQPLTSCDPNAIHYLPSPNDLHRKVLIKGKMISTPKEETELQEEEEEEEPKEKEKKDTKHPHPKVAPELSELVYLKAASFGKGFGEKQFASWETCSFSEVKAEKLSEKDGVKFAEHNTKNWSKIYPKGVRMDSSNCNPCVSWNTGCQAVAMNFQTLDEGMYIYNGMFSDNGNSGYILKPQSLIKPSDKLNPPSFFNPFDPQCLESGVASKYSKLVVTVISARLLPIKQDSKNEVLDPYVVLQIHGVPVDHSSRQTSIIRNNGFNPTWNEEFVFDLKASNLDILLIKVLDYEKIGGYDKIGWYSLRVDNIRSGFRCIPLRDEQNRRIPICNLLCKFELF